MVTTKKLFCLFVVWAITISSSSLIGQSAPDTLSIEEQLLNAFTELDPSEITTGILYERVPEYVSLDMYDGRELPDSMAMSLSTFEMAYGMINWSHYENSGLTPIDSFFDTAKKWKDSRIGVLSAMYFKYNRFKENVLEDSLIVVDTSINKFYRGSNTSTSPYIEDTLFAITSMRNKSHSLQQEFVLDETVLFSNMTLGFAGAEIDFGDGQGFRSVLPAQSFTITYPDYDNYVITLKLIDTNGNQLQAKTFIEITPETSQSPPPLNDPYGSADLVKMIPEPDCETVTVYDPYDGYPEGEIEICTPHNIEIWHFKNNLCGNTEIRKPLILLDGFDVDGSKDHEFVKGILEDGLANSLGAILHPEEYDIFYIDYVNSTIDIFEQAEYVRIAIEWINEQKALSGSLEENVVVGFSMGGIVGKIALRKMELAGVDHETRLFYTFDSPMKGANVPLSMQFLIKHISEYKLFGKELRYSNNLSSI